MSSRVEEIIDIIFSLPKEEREEVERGIKERKEGMKRSKEFKSFLELKGIVKKRGERFRSLEELKELLEKHQQKSR